MSTRREFLRESAIVGLSAVAGARATFARAENSTLGKAESVITTIKVPNIELAVTRVAYGCAFLGTPWDSPDFVSKAVPAIGAAYDRGIRFFDLADVYGFGNAETALGLVMQQRAGMRRSIVIQSKCGDQLFKGGIVDNSYQHIVKSAEGSLKRLGTDYLDLLLLHWPDSLVNPAEVARAFDELHRAGKVRYFGVSNHNWMQIELLAKVVRQPLAVNQIQLGLAHWYVPTADYKVAFMHSHDAAATLDYCRLHNVQVQAYSPLRGGRGFDLLRVPDDASADLKRAAQLLAEVATKYGVTPAAIMIAWLLNHPAGIVPIIGTATPQRIAEACAADGVQLSRADWYALLQAATNVVVAGQGT